ncbi:hypothetical protein [Streptomyces auratus]|uniref:Uncharacterized protein n=1 Tax=Streptomyces auratus AGR0001 TaxID=1160718 RepID=A0A8B1NNG7_9ACTN|nr:hypothetical protein SU9_033710 [Streptomyces auratus AGR0001]
MPTDREDEATAFWQRRGGTGVVPDVGATVLVDVAAVVVAGAGVDADLTVAVEAEVAEALAVAGLVGQGPALDIDWEAAGVLHRDPLCVQASVGTVIPSGAVVLDHAQDDSGAAVVRGRSVMAVAGMTLSWLGPTPATSDRSPAAAI